MNNLFKKAVFCFFLFSFSLASADEMKKNDVSIGAVFGANGSTTVSGSALFSGKAKTYGGPEITVSTKPFDQAPNLIVSGRLSGEEVSHEASFVGASIGGQKCDTFASMMVGWDFTPNQPIDLRASIGGKHVLNCGGRYAMGGVAFKQTDMNENVGVAEISATGKLGFVSEKLKDVSLGAYARYSGEMKSSVNLPGNTVVENKTGGDIEGGIILRIPFGTH